MVLIIKRIKSRIDCNKFALNCSFYFSSQLFQHKMGKSLISCEKEMEIVACGRSCKNNRGTARCFSFVWLQFSRLKSKSE